MIFQLDTKKEMSNCTLQNAEESAMLDLRRICTPSLHEHLSRAVRLEQTAIFDKNCAFFQQELPR